MRTTPALALLLTSLALTFIASPFWHAQEGPLAREARPGQDMAITRVLDGWLVNGSEAVEGEVIVLNGNLTVAPGGRLTLINTTLLLNGSRARELAIEVLGGGELRVLNGSLIAAYRPGSRFSFSVKEGARLYMRDSVLRDCGTGRECLGLTVRAEEAIIENCLFANNLAGLVLSGSNGSRVLNCTFIGNSAYGILLERSEDVLIAGCRVIGGTYGLACEGCENITISGCLVRASASGLEVIRSRGVRVEDCAIGGERCALTCASSTQLDIRDCVLGPCERGSGLILHGSSHVHAYNVNASGNRYDGVECHGSDHVLLCDCLLIDNGWNGFSCDSSSHLVLSGCLVCSNGHYGIVLDLCDGARVEGCIISGNGAAGVRAYDTSSLYVIGCRVSENYQGIFCCFCPGATLRYCDVISNERDGLQISYSRGALVAYCIIGWNGRHGIACAGCEGLRVRCCDIFSNGGFGLLNEDKYPVLARENWWGGPNGPERGHAERENPEEVEGPAYVWPWLEEPARLVIEPPRVEILWPENGTVIASDEVTVSWRVRPGSMRVKRVELRLDDGPWIDVTAARVNNFTFTGLSEGEHVVTIRVLDEVGVEGRAAVRFIVVLRGEEAGWPELWPLLPSSLLAAMIGLTALLISLLRRSRIRAGGGGPGPTGGPARI